MPGGGDHIRRLRALLRITASVEGPDREKSILMAFYAFSLCARQPRELQIIL